MLVCIADDVNIYSSVSEIIYIRLFLNTLKFNYNLRTNFPFGIFSLNYFPLNIKFYLHIIFLMKHLSTSTRIEGWQYTFPHSPAGALRTTIFNGEHHTHHHNDTSIALSIILPNIENKYYGSQTDSEYNWYFK